MLEGGIGNQSSHSPSAAAVSKGKQAQPQVVDLAPLGERKVLDLITVVNSKHFGIITLKRAYIWDR